jgi:hypothetical protein
LRNRICDLRGWQCAQPDRNQRKVRKARFSGNAGRYLAAARKRVNEKGHLFTRNRREKVDMESGKIFKKVEIVWERQLRRRQRWDAKWELSRLKLVNSCEIGSRRQSNLADEGKT